MNKKYYELIDETLYSFTCDNGLKVYLLPKNDYHKTYGVFATNFGSLYQDFKADGKQHKIIDGAAHFLEHKMFEKKDYDVMEIFSKQSATSNAFTSFDKTAYLFTATDQVSKNVETLLDFVQDLYLSDESVEKEKPIIASEIAMYDDEVEWQAFFRSLQGMYHNNPVKVDIAGTKDTIYEITKEDLTLYYDYFYHPSNMILFVCGKFDLDEIEKVIKDNQNKKEFKQLSYELIEKPEPDDVVSPCLTSTMEINKSRVTFGIKINEYLFDSLKQDVIMGILSDMLFARTGVLFQDLINKQLISSNYNYQYNQDHIFNYAYLQLFYTTKDSDILIDYLYEYFKKDLSNDLIESEFEAIKAKYIGDYIRLFNSPEQIANAFIAYKFMDYDFFDIIEVVKEISFNDLKKALKLLNLDYSSISIIKPNEK